MKKALLKGGPYHGKTVGVTDWPHRYSGKDGMYRKTDVLSTKAIPIWKWTAAKTNGKEAA